ncbi:hypothetical protein CLAFUW4_08563 [Fulvia fulva]|uniref:Uncharacterized protein n=1 Tax=Passalora fulva TaxID=5499 RepID=A0A9Q8P662_PASFU|nr:uncharacterized protein CLAFUR5_08665 [Fulvia fulva]KAK4628723.1 hypothetical protein CLAFUR4_08566 [Fulvia fulva]KAK4630651.1 hypothetical protein CLAFUR0_08561 [Fulvia fulva]UJO14713.1 hypothetical protein CLAFUR5_08665 [Fulvia fulva]WPV12403.1 hypothetical protein CLAFUW4_08563 [Fulvia fulva]WPV27412.1 hypothetical protein CLAFUW7_08561 [Fulvia fulva]
MKDAALLQCRESASVTSRGRGQEVNTATTMGYINPVVLLEIGTHHPTITNSINTTTRTTTNQTKSINMYALNIIAASFAIVGAMANSIPSQMGVEVIRENGNVLVREVAHPLSKRACTNCVHVGGHCIIGEGNCYSTENALCTDCGAAGTICVDRQGGSCSAP